MRPRQIIALLAGCLMLFNVNLASAAENTVKIVMHAPLRVLDPVFTNAYITRNHGYLVYDTLFALDDKSAPQPQMVDQWTVSTDKLTYNFKLRAGLKFHDGTNVTGDDVIASLQRWGARDQMGLRLIAVVKEMTSDDPLSFRIVLKKPYGLVTETLAKPSAPVPFIMPKRIALTPVTEAISEQVGSGPYKFAADAFQAGVKASYLKFADYVPRQEPASGFAGGKFALFDRIDVTNIPDPQTAVNALRKGEVDFIEYLSPDLAPQLDKVPGIIIKKSESTSRTYVMKLNWLQPPFNNAGVRRAALMALNQMDYLQASFDDPSLYTTCGAVLTCVSPYKSEEGATQTREPNLQAARALLKESGYDGTKVVVLHPTDLRSLANLGPVTAQALRSIGMNVEIASTDWASLLARRGSKAPVGEGGWSVFNTVLLSVDLMDPIVNSFLDGRGEAGYAGWSKDEEMERLRDLYAEAGNPEERMRVAVNIQKRAYDQVIYLPLGSYGETRAYNSKFTNMVDAPVVLFWKGKASQ